MKFAFFLGGLYQKYQSTIARALGVWARKRGVSLYVFGTFSTPGSNILYAEAEKNMMNLPVLKDFDGILIAGDTLDAFGIRTDITRRLEKEIHGPVVSIRSTEERYSNILLDNEKAMWELTRHFIDEHHMKDICFVTGIMGMLDANERLAGYKRAMSEAGLPVTEDMIYYGDYWKKHGKEIVDFFLKGRDSYPPVIICSNDYMALSVCQELAKRGVKIPEEVCVSGFDDLPEAQIFSPPLTNVRVPFEEMAQKALDQAIFLAEQLQEKAETEEKSETKDKPWESEKGANDILVNSQCKFRSSCGCHIDEEEVSQDIYQEEIGKYRYMTKECVYMSSNFESVLTEKECLELTGHYAKEFGMENCFICLCEKTPASLENISEYSFTKQMYLRGYFNEKREFTLCDIPFSLHKLLPDEFQMYLDGKVNVFVTLHCKNEVQGYLIFQLGDGQNRIVSEKFEFLCLNLGNSLKKIQMYDELFSMKNIKQLYLCDPLTNIYNRRGFDRKLMTIYENMKRQEQKIAVVCMDMDGLKYINDHFGHKKGDEAIIAVSRCLHESLTEGEFCGRMGGDEFEAVLLMNDQNRIACFKEKLQKKLREINQQIREDYVIDISIGISVVEKTDALMEYIQVADKKMYADKRSKKNKQGER